MRMSECGAYLTQNCTSLRDVGSRGGIRAVDGRAWTGALRDASGLPWRKENMKQTCKINWNRGWQHSTSDQITRGEWEKKKTFKMYIWRLCGTSWRFWGMVYKRALNGSLEGGVRLWIYDGDCLRDGTESRRAVVSSTWGTIREERRVSATSTPPLSCLPNPGDKKCGVGLAWTGEKPSGKKKTPWFSKCCPPPRGGCMAEVDIWQSEHGVF